ncbi:MAG: M48 family metallopeptidase [Gammaproteobacteria bacterium]|nr:M48 family metallopeptidase [Gammaproteobacteria bacterium]
MLRVIQFIFLMVVVAVNPLGAQGVDVGNKSVFTGLISASQIESQALNQYKELLQKAKAQNALLADNHPLVIKLRKIASRIIPLSYSWNERAKNWDWQINMIQSKQINAFCMPGGKIVFYSAIIEQLKLTDDEIAMVMGHEIAHALREHARERMGKTATTQAMASVGGWVASLVLGVDQRLTQEVARAGGQLLTLKFSRGDETESDLVGLELAAKAGYDPRASVSLWHKMDRAHQSKSLEWLSTHPSHDTRIKELEKNIPKVLAFYENTKNIQK